VGLNCPSKSPTWEVEGASGQGWAKEGGGGIHREGGVHEKEILESENVLLGLKP